MASVQVLCPNGRRQNVKITPNTKLLQVLEDVCQKQKFLPTEEYKLVRGRNTLDLTLSVRYSNLPNNAKLELVKCDMSRAESPVILALQLETGDRLQHEFQPSTSLWQILEHWEAQDDGKHAGKLTKTDCTVHPSVQPVCIYMREEVTGEFALRETQLRTLGLTGGKAVLRLLHRPVEDEVLEEIKTHIEKEKLRKARMGQTVPSHLERPQERVQSAVSAGSDVVADTFSAQSKPESKTICSQVASELPVSCEIESERKAGREEESHDIDEPMEVELTTAAGVEATMEMEEVVSSSSDASMQQTVPDAQSEQQNAVNRLRDIPGLQVFTPDDFHDLSPEQQQVARQMAQSFLSSMSAGSGMVQQQGAVVKKKPRQQQKAPFTDFKFPEETKGKNLYSNELSSVRTDDFKPCDRQTMVFNIEEAVRLTDPSESNQELSDEFFELTERDIRSLMSEKQRQLHELEDQPLMTSAMRKARLEELYGKYERVVIRVQFHDKLVLQGVFRPRETIFAVQKFVKDHLEDKRLQFYLYTSPPKCVLKDKTKTLIEAKLIPAALIYFGCEDHKVHYLSEAVLTETSSKLQADILVAECLGATNSENQSSLDLPATYTGKGKQPVKAKTTTTESSSAPAASSSAASSSSQSDKQVPKWFKVGPKK